MQQILIIDDDVYIGDLLEELLTVRLRFPLEKPGHGR